MKYIGKLDKNKLGEYKNKIVTDIVVMTNERIKHIQTRHPGDYEKYFCYIPYIINNPDYILKDKDNVDTILFLKTIEEESKHIQVVVKLETNKNQKEKYNSIITFWNMRLRSYMSIIKNNIKIYERVDKSE